MRRLILLALVLVCTALPVRAQLVAGPLVMPGGVVPGSEGSAARSAFERPLDPETAPLYYAVDTEAPVYAEPDEGTATPARLALRDGVRVLAEEDGWSLIEWDDRRGYVRSAALSNVWVRVDKSDRAVYVYRGTELVRTYPADVAASEGDKVRRSALGETEHYRVPEGTFYVCRKNPNSQYYRALVVSYPNVEHAARGLRDGLISQTQYDAIAEANAAFRVPPMGTSLGGLIELHGTGSGRQRAWTRGCVALRNVHMQELYDLVHVGTPIVIEP
jgi:lipoprotein-anchoring transpeptidase ErfK/SrfK